MAKPPAPDLKSLRRAAELLGSARTGSRLLDYKVAAACGLVGDRGLEILRRALSPAGDVSAMEMLAVDAAVPPLTTSLDATLPWEETVACRRDGDVPAGGWRVDASVRLTPSGMAVEVSSGGRTEALARRRAAVSGRVLVLCAKRHEPTNRGIREALAALEFSEGFVLAEPTPGGGAAPAGALPEENPHG